MTMHLAEQELVDVIERLEACGDELKVSARCEKTALPKQSRIAETLSCYRHLLFPQLGDDSGRHRDAEWMRQQACHLQEMLGDEIRWALEQSPATGQSAGDSAAASRRLAGELMHALPDIKTQLFEDAHAALAGDPACTGLPEVVLCYPGFLAITVHRLAHELYRRQVKLLARMLSEWVHGETGIDIHPGAQIGRHFFIDHGTGVVIGETCVVGDRVRIYQGVTLGALSFARDENGNLVRDSKRHPTIENDVVIYANATVLGGKTVVGHHSIIGASVWLAHSIAPFTTVVMEQPKLRFRNQSPTAFDQPPDYQI